MKPSESESNAVGRRSFLLGSAAGLAGLTAARTTEVSLGAQTESVAGPKGQDITDEIDVLVVGGGSAGTIAAIQAGRTGAKTMVMERASYLGGMTTRGGVCFPGLFDAWGKQIIAGIGWELVSECVGFGTRRRVLCKQIVGYPKAEQDEDGDPAWSLYFVDETITSARDLLDSALLRIARGKPGDKP